LSATGAAGSSTGRWRRTVGSRDEAFVRSILAGRTWKEAARETGLAEERAKSFLLSIARFAGTIGAPADFVLPEAMEEASPRAMHHSELIVYTDGASNGNPGPSGAGGVIMTPDGTTIEEFHVHLGRATNNVAEYEAVRIALTKALAYGARRVHVRLDSELVANQLSGRYKVKDSKLIDRYLRVGELLSQLDSATFEAIPREQNARADMLAQVGAKSAR
jgi:ribonuclease HI